MKLSTKLALLVVTGVVGALAIGVPGAIDRIDRARAASDTQDQVRALQSLVQFHELADREATLSAWYVASGETAARRTLASVRPLADRAARALDVDGRAAGSPLAPAVARVERAWTVLREGRATIDRRVVTDIVALTRFDAVSGAVRRALDLGVATDAPVPAAAVRSLAAVDGLRAAAAREQAAVAVVVSRAGVTPAVLDRIRGAATEQADVRDRALTSARDTAGPTVDDDLGALRAATAVVRTTRAPVLLGVVPFITPAQWQQRSDDQLHALATVAAAVGSSVDTRTAAVRHDARDGVVGWLVLLGAVIAGIVVIGFVVARSVRRPLRAVRDAAVALAERERTALESPATHRTEPEIAAPAVRTEDEIGDIARAVTAVDRTVVESLGQQRRTRHNGLSDLYVNIARRNQPLLSRQLALIDSLQTSEPSADRSVVLAELDHLAVRMRRNSESLLVLAGLDPLRSHPDPAPLIDVVHAALGEIEDEHRVDIVEVPADLAVQGRIVVDLVHTLAELVENATTYSPPATRVYIGTLQRPGAIDVTVSDAGEGLPVDRLDALNEQLQHPPLPGFDLSRSLGLVVVARLCERIGVSVALRSTPGVGTAAVLTIPIALVVGAPTHQDAERTPLIDLSRTDADEGTAPVADDRLPVPAVVAPPLPRRERVDAMLGPVSELQRPESRPPGAVFELVARFEAGRRRAARTEASEDSESD